MLTRNLLITLIFILLPLFVYPGESFAAESVSYTVSSQREEVYNNSSLSPDYPYWTQNVNDAPSVGYLIYKDIRRTGQVVDPKITDFLQSGTYKTKMSSAAFDGRGRWLGGIYDDNSGTLRGFYHAEAVETISCDPISGIKSIAYAESNDGGLSWTIPNYPNNQIITGQFSDGAGDFRLREFGGYLYIYYYEAACGDNFLSQGTAVARASVASKGKPGSWLKYFCDQSGCGFKQPALGGRSTKPSFNGKHTTNISTLVVSWNKYLNKYIAAGSIGGDTVLFMTSSDLVNWTLIPPVYNVPAFPENGTFQAYRNILSLNGDMNTTNQSFWLYYVGVNRGRKEHVLYRQKVTLTKTGTLEPKKGDANSDNKIDFSDFVILKSYYGLQAPIWPDGKNKGNFNLDTKVDGIDYAIWYREFGK